VTDVPEKQISIALAVLTACRYLVGDRLVTLKAGVDDEWA
jgi:hypothetical protein